MAFYRKRVVKPDTAADIAEWIAYRKACEQARAERQEKFPVLTMENFEEAGRYEERRIRELKE